MSPRRVTFFKNWEIVLSDLLITHQIGPECAQKHYQGEYDCFEHSFDTICRRLDHILNFDPADRIRVSDLRKNREGTGVFKSYSKILKAARRAAKFSGVLGIFLDSGFFFRVFSGVPKSKKKGLVGA